MVTELETDFIREKEKGKGQCLVSSVSCLVKA